MRKIILDTTFTIPVRIDSPERLRNLEIATRYLHKFFYANILIGEDSPTPILKNYGKNGGYIHYKNDDELFHRTKILNNLAFASSTPFIVNFDADIIIPPSQIISGLDLLRENKADMVLPYNGEALNIIDKKVTHFGKTLELRDIKKGDTYEMNKNALGGAVMWNKKTFIKFGMENENFKNWGYEDNERMSRAQKLGLRIYRIPGKLFHLDHKRDDKVNFTHKYADQNRKELGKIGKMSGKEIMEYIKTWEWAK